MAGTFFPHSLVLVASFPLAALFLFAGPPGNRQIFFPFLCLEIVEPEFLRFLNQGFLHMLHNELLLVWWQSSHQIAQVGFLARGPIERTTSQFLRKRETNSTRGNLPRRLLDGFFLRGFASRRLVKMSRWVQFRGFFAMIHYVYLNNNDPQPMRFLTSLPLHSLEVHP